ncbi:hypothetical protein EDC04DRAFT_2871863 [Pisolithus marmoratus]|nr:hypothetical protein EDC04DRAFT_2871863 [Pisolithus marmoratus]
MALNNLRYVSNAGGELIDLAQELLGELFKDYSHKGLQRKDCSYLDWSYTWANEGSKEYFPKSVDDGSSSMPWTLHVIDVYHKSAVLHTMESAHCGPATDLFITSALIHQGVVPCSPIHPTAAVTFRCLELFHIVWLHSPHFSIQAFVKTLCDLQGCYLSCQFSIAFDLYLQIYLEDWCLKHACAACTYKLTDEPELKFKLLYAMDGNNSLKCFLHHLPDKIEDGHPLLSCDLPTDLFSNEDSDSNPCAGHWKNMDDVKTKKAWGVYDETGIFMVVCCHGTCLLMADMVQSGKCAKYPLAVVSKLMAAFSDGLGGGTLSTSTLGPQARALNHTCLVGAFHGHAHHQLCQLSHLTLYMEGLGLEDLETCEHTFSKFNALASTQAINTYFEHNDNFEIYANLTKFLFNNYKQVLRIIHDSKTILPNLKHDLSIDNDTIFHRWLEEEKKYLEGLTHKPLEETLQMEYWQKLGKLEVSSQRLHVILDMWNAFKPANTTTYSGDTRNYNKNLLLVQELECKLDISSCWVPEDKEWQNVGCLVANWEYHCALDNLESLVVAQLFELTKMNRAGTGYKLWKHIAKALQTHSAAIKAALNCYNKSDSDLLWDMCEDISKHPWAHPTVQFAEEMEHLNIEICQVITYIHDEEHFLHTCEEKINDIHPALAHQFNHSHLKCLYDIGTLLEFSGTLYPGESTLKGPGESSHCKHFTIFLQKIC